MSLSRTRSMSLGGGENVRANREFDVEQDNSIEVVIPGSSTDEEVGLVVDLSQVKLIAILSDQDITIETNDSGTPVQTFTIGANKLFHWEEGNGMANPVTTDITKIYVTNAGSDDANLTIVVWQDATP